ncbi:DUF5606 family protein [Mesohalobacter halotolerans]|uniref:Uncharacterized protein n=1 Tax=Mesohalobacter halotolerans TaxID=1883405 RepID=A0A4U5TQB8_9FLAO|nr:DUF5606 domain-containing protein [Mesohalobacter halotolerans]MBS3738571.1 DUF5606 domain-containing protein [Psychroflexus sp.]TKS56400.1 hypothetical protein FCN74_04985 [Mesohalobacter halotolerans]
MEFDKILSVSGKPGLYELKTQTRAGVLAQSLIDGRKIQVNLRNNISILSEISIYTYADEVPLNEVFSKIYQKTDGQKSIDHKSSKKELESYFREILPEYDEDRVYQSDIKKVIQWYNILIDNDYTDFQDEEKSDEEE